MSKIHFQASLDSDNHRFIIHPLKDGGAMDIRTAFKAIIQSDAATYKSLAEFCGLKNQSASFKITYTSFSRPIITELEEFLTIDINNNQAYLYDINHKPASVVKPHVGPEVVNNEPENIVIKENSPFKISTRVVISDPLDRRLTMKLRPLGGYLLGVNNVILSTPMDYAVDGSVAGLNNLLDQISFVATAPGNCSLTISVNDNEKADTSISSILIQFKAEAVEKPSVPELILPSDIVTDDLAIGEVFEFDPIEVADEDGKVMEFRITPFGCSIIGFKSYLAPIGRNEIRTVLGTPDTINTEINDLAIIPTQLKPQLGVELRCDGIVIREYLLFDNATEPVLSPVDEITIAPSSVYAYSSEVIETPSITFANTAPRELPSSVTVTTSANFKAENLLYKDEVISIAGGETMVFEGFPHELNAIFANANFSAISRVEGSDDYLSSSSITFVGGETAIGRISIRTASFKTPSFIDVKKDTLTPVTGIEFVYADTIETTTTVSHTSNPDHVTLSIKDAEGNVIQESNTSLTITGIEADVNQQLSTLEIIMTEYQPFDIVLSNPVLRSDKLIPVSEHFDIPTSTFYPLPTSRFGAVGDRTSLPRGNLTFIDTEDATRHHSIVLTPYECKFHFLTEDLIVTSVVESEASEIIEGSTIELNDKFAAIAITVSLNATNPRFDITTGDGEVFTFNLDVYATDNSSSGNAIFPDYRYLNRRNATSDPFDIRFTSVDGYPDDMIYYADIFFGSDTELGNNVTVHDIKAKGITTLTSANSTEGLFTFVGTIDELNDMFAQVKFEFENTAQTLYIYGYSPVEVYPHLTDQDAEFTNVVMQDTVIIAENGESVPTGIVSFDYIPVNTDVGRVVALGVKLTGMRMENVESTSGSTIYAYSVQFIEGETASEIMGKLNSATLFVDQKEGSIELFDINGSLGTSRVILNA